MDFSLSEEQQKIRTEIKKLGKSLNRDLVQKDSNQEFNQYGWDICGKFGFQGFPAPIEYNGGGSDALTTVIALESLGYACKDNGLIFSINAHLWTCVMPLVTFGNESQKGKYLPKLNTGEWIGGNAISEPDSGSDAMSMRTTATLNGDHYILNGSKTFITNAPIADVLIAFATINSDKKAAGVTAFIIEKNMSGFVVGNKIEKMGNRTSPMAELFFENCEVPIKNRLGVEGGGLAIFSHSMEWERAFILSSVIGVMDRQLEECIKYAKERTQFGKAIGKNQLVSTKIVDMKLRLETARNLLYKTAWMKDQGKSIFLEAAMTKLYLSESWVQSSLDAIQIFGGYGYMTEYEQERNLRDAVGSRIYSGTSEIQRQIIARFLKL